MVLGTSLILGGIGCHKSTNATGGNAPKTIEEGVANLQAAVATASPEVQSNFYQGVSYGIRYGDYAKASSSLQQIASDPSLNDQQKKAVSDVSDLLKQAIANGRNPAQPAQPAH